MREVERQLDRILNLLRNKIRQRGFTQLEVQEALGWGRSYISQLLTKQKSLRVEQILLVLKVIGVDPAAFFIELYPPPADAFNPARRALSGDSSVAALEKEYRSVRSLLRGLVDLLVNQDVVTPDELSAAVHGRHPLPDDDS